VCRVEEGGVVRVKCWQQATSPTDWAGCEIADK